MAEYAASGFGLSSPDPVCFITASGTDEKIVTERGAMLTRFYEQAKSVLRRHWPLVEALAAELVKRDTLIYEEIRTICERVEKRFERGEKKGLQKVGEGADDPLILFC